MNFIEEYYCLLQLASSIELPTWVFFIAFHHRIAWLHGSLQIFNAMHCSKIFTVNHCLSGATFHFLFKLVLKKQGEGEREHSQRQFQTCWDWGSKLRLECTALQLICSFELIASIESIKLKKILFLKDNIHPPLTVNCYRLV